MIPSASASTSMRIDSTNALFSNADSMLNLTANAPNMNIFKVHEKEKEIELDMLQNNISAKIATVMEETQEKQSDEYWKRRKKEMLDAVS